MPRLSYDETAKQNISKLIDYAVKHLYLQEYDCTYVQNTLLDLLDLSEPTTAPLKDNYDIYSVLSALCEYAVRKKIIDESERGLFETKLLGIVSPLPSKVVELFDDMAAYKSVEEACNMLHSLGKDSLYLRQRDLDKNIIWKHSAPRGDIIITINLSKPEKTPEQVRLAKEAKTGYPKCALCAQNVGFAGNAAMAARQTLRTIPFTLDGEEWFMQFSPYQYFDQHVIAICQEHRPMGINDGAFRRMADFIDLFPHYFIGSNAALPIVGGSILAHDHYQGGKKVLPVFTRPDRKTFDCAQFDDVKVSVVDWYNSIVRIEGKNRDRVLSVVSKFNNSWQNYDDESVGIISHVDKDGERTQHNAITPIASFNADGEYRFDLILRNNRTDEAHPFGIFHPAAELHNIKQESIGIIEVMGLFILPGRLANEMRLIRDILTGATPLDFEALSKDTHPLHKHFGMITQLVVDYNTNCTDKQANEAITAYINRACEQILDTTAVFKNTEQGQAAFSKFVHKVIG